MRQREEFEESGGWSGGVEMNYVVCLEEVGKIGMVMPCEHVFYEDCIFRWSKKSHVCALSL